jgi:hypothetical protein
VEKKSCVEDEGVSESCEKIAQVVNYVRIFILLCSTSFETRTRREAFERAVGWLGEVRKTIQAAREHLTVGGRPATRLWLRFWMQILFIGLLWWSTQ